MTPPLQLLALKFYLPPSRSNEDAQIVSKSLYNVIISLQELAYILYKAAKKRLIDPIAVERILKVDTIGPKHSGLEYVTESSLKVKASKYYFIIRLVDKSILSSTFVMIRTYQGIIHLNQ